MYGVAAIAAIVILTLSGTVSLASMRLPPTTPSQQQGGSSSQSKKSTQARQHSNRARSTGSLLTLPLKKTWQYFTADASLLPPTLDPAHAYVPLAAGRVVCLDRETGALIWTSEPGGTIASPIVQRDGLIYVASNYLDETGSDAGSALRAVDKSTGLTVWMCRYPRTFSSPLAVGIERLFAGLSDGTFNAFDVTDGRVRWSAAMGDKTRALALVTAEAVYFGCDDGILRAVKPDDGHLVWKTQTVDKIVARPATDGRSVYFGSSNGYVYSVDATSGRLQWSIRTGAGIESGLAIDESEVIVASLDNFVYALSTTRGDKIWKRRLPGRIAGDPLIDKGYTIVATLRGQSLAVFRNTDGRPVNYFTLDPDVEIAAGPVLLDQTMAVPTDKGLILASVVITEPNPE
jgi:outer membrane protein assembly factor BamB